MEGSTRIHKVLALTLALFATPFALGCGDDSPGDAGGGADGSTGGMDGATGGMDGSIGGMDAGPGFTLDGAMVSFDGGSAETCSPARCGGQLYQCGNCMDDDGDGLIDVLGPDCLGACDNNEGGYDLGIPGGEVGNCPRDCYFDTNQGRSDCQYDIQCDPATHPAPLASTA